MLRGQHELVHSLIPNIYIASDCYKPQAPVRQESGLADIRVGGKDLQGTEITATPCSRVDALF